MIDVQNVYKTFLVPHEVKALVDVTTKIEAGEVVVVIGPSGSGKSTLLRCLNHLETATSLAGVADGEHDESAGFCFIGGDQPSLIGSHLGRGHDPDESIGAAAHGLFELRVGADRDLGPKPA